MRQESVKYSVICPCSMENVLVMIRKRQTEKPCIKWASKEEKFLRITSSDVSVSSTKQKSTVLRFLIRQKPKMLEEGANLSWQSQQCPQNLKSNTFGHEHDYSRLKKVLMNLDCTSEKITQGGKTSAPSFAEISGGQGSDRTEADSYPTGPTDGGQCGSVSSSSSSSSSSS